MVLQTISAGPKVSRIAAPGVDIRASVPADTYQCLSGTRVATPHLSGVVALMFSANSGLTADQARHILRHEGSPIGGGDLTRIMESAKHPPTRQEILVDSARELLADASQQGLTAQQVLDRRHPIQDEMPRGFRNNSERDRYYQSRVDDRAELADVLRGLEQAPGFTGRGSDWSSEQRVDIKGLDALSKARFYSDLDARNQAYYNKVLTQLQA